MVVIYNRRDWLKGSMAAVAGALASGSVVAAAVEQLAPVVPPVEPIVPVPSPVAAVPLLPTAGLTLELNFIDPPIACPIEFSKLSPSAQRMAVYQDVIETLTAGKANATEQRYLGHIEQSRLPAEVLNNEDALVNDALPAMRKHCHTCALGNLLLAFANQSRSVRFWSLVNARGSYYVDFIDGVALTRKLSSLFDDAQLELLEAAFEGESFAITTLKFSCNERKDSPYRIACTYKWRYATESARLLAVCRNAIRNGGTFIPVELEPGEDVDAAAETA